MVLAEANIAVTSEHANVSLPTYATPMQMFVAGPSIAQQPLTTNQYQVQYGSQLAYFQPGHVQAAYIR